MLDDTALLDAGGDVTTEEIDAVDEPGPSWGVGVVIPFDSTELISGGLDATVLEPAATLDARTLEYRPGVLEGFDSSENLIWGE